METKNINFIKKFYYSIFRIKNYNLLVDLGLKKCLAYIFKLLLIVSIVFATIQILILNKSVIELRSYLEKNLPDLQYEDGILASDNTERIVLDDEIVYANFGGKIVIDTNDEPMDIANEYKNLFKPTIILTKDKYITIDEAGIIRDAPYQEVFLKYLNKEIKSIDKEELLYMFDDYAYSVYFFGHTISYFLVYSVLIFVSSAIISLFILLYCKIKRMYIKYKKIHITVLYSFTIIIIGFCGAYYFNNTISSIIKIVSMVATTIILIETLFIKKVVSSNQ